jgi:hypothetical protein
VSVFPFQKLTASAAYRRLRKDAVVAIADEAGLGKTHAVISIIARIAQRAPDASHCVYYVASNLLLATQNADRIRDTLVDLLGEERVHRPKAGRILELSHNGPTKPGVYLIPVTPRTSLACSSSGTRREHALVEQAYPKRSIDRNGRPVLRRRLVRRKLAGKWPPALLILDEYQTYLQCLNQPDKSVVPFLIADVCVPTLLVSATPFEVRLPTAEDAAKASDDYRPTFSFDIFASLISRFDAVKSERLVDSQKAYARAWRAVLTHLRHKRQLTAASPEIAALRRARTDFEKRLAKHVLRTYRTSLAQPEIVRCEDPAATFRQLTRLHLAAHAERGWFDNAHIFTSSMRFYEPTAGRKFEHPYKLGKHLSKAGLRKLRQVIAMQDSYEGKKVMLERELVDAGLDGVPPLWVAPCSKSAKASPATEKLLLFSGFRATPMEICAHLQDAVSMPRSRRMRRWYISRSKRVEEAALFWLRPGYALAKLGADVDKADELSLRRLAKASEQERKIFGTASQQTSWEERTADSPGSGVWDALLEVLAAYDVNPVTSAAALKNAEVIASAVELKKALDHYLGNPRSLVIMRKSLGKQASRMRPAAVIKRYCEAYRWRAMWTEYFDQLLGAKLESGVKDLCRELANAFAEASTALLLRPTERRRKNKPVWISYVSTVLARTDSDQSTNRPDAIRKAFNSPFAPFVLITTSVGEEGLDFHRYCRRQIHWDPPPSGSSLAQRIGRTVRFRGLLQRRGYQAPAGSSFIWKKQVRDEEAGGLIPNFQSEANAGDRPIVKIFALPFTGQYGRAVEVKRHYEDLKYFVGMTASQLAELLPLLLDTKLDDATRHLLADCTIDLKPKPGKGTKAKNKVHKTAA